MNASAQRNPPAIGARRRPCTEGRIATKSHTPSGLHRWRCYHSLKTESIQSLAELPQPPELTQLRQYQRLAILPRIGTLVQYPGRDTYNDSVGDPDRGGVPSPFFVMRRPTP